MKKRFAAVLLIAVAAVSSLAAVDISLAVGGQGTFGELKVGKNTSYNVSVDAELDMDFGRGQGMLIGLLVGTSDFDFNITQNMYIRLGTGFITDFGKLNNEYASNPKFIIPLPAIGFGWDF